MKFCKVITSYKIYINKPQMDLYVGCAKELFKKCISTMFCQQILKEIQKRGVVGIKTYKLNVKIPNFMSIKYLLFLNTLYYQLSHQYPNKTQYFYHILLKPLQQQNGTLQIKTILKWMISAQLNSNQDIKLQSTTVEDQYTLIVCIEQDYINRENQKKIMNLFSVQLPAGKAANPLKKIKLQHKDLKCTQANILKISKLSNQQLMEILEPLYKQTKLIKIIQGQFPSQKTQRNFITSLELQSVNIYLSGKYIKFSRYLSQTPWVINGKKLTPSSLQQQIQNPLLQFFYPEKKREQVQIKFHSGGRQDIDVRMLQGGRPFVIELVSPLRRLAEINEKQILHKIHNCEDKQTLKRKQLQLKDKLQDLTQKQKIIHYLQVLINSTNKDVKVKNFAEATVNYISIQLKAAQMEKVKHYICFYYFIATYYQRRYFQNQSNIQSIYLSENPIKSITSSDSYGQKQNGSQNGYASSFLFIVLCYKSGQVQEPIQNNLFMEIQIELFPIQEALWVGKMLTYYNQTQEG